MERLDFHRATLLRKLEGLDDEQLLVPQDLYGVAAGNLDDMVATPWGAEVNLRAILIHLVQETARHNGHADLIREALDGTTGH